MEQNCHSSYSGDGMLRGASCNASYGSCRSRATKSIMLYELVGSQLFILVKKLRAIISVAAPIKWRLWLETRFRGDTHYTSGLTKATRQHLVSHDGHTVWKHKTTLAQSCLLVVHIAWTDCRYQATLIMRY